MTLSKKQVVILIGPPGSGKGTQAELLSSKLNLYHFETSKLLEHKFSEDFSEQERYILVGDERFDILEEHKIWKQGKLCSPPFVAFIVKEKIKELFDQDKSIVFSGSPRTLFEAQELIPLLEELYKKENIKVAFLQISPEQTIHRNSHRRICELARHSILYTKETQALTICPLDGSKLVRRVGLDDPETIVVRIKEYEERTFPVIEFLEKEGIKIVKINGERPVSEVFDDILSKI